jgi:hypothetical protein
MASRWQQQAAHSRLVSNCQLHRNLHLTKPDSSNSRLPAFNNSRLPLQPPTAKALGGDISHSYSEQLVCSSTMLQVATSSYCCLSMNWHTIT